MDAPDLALAKFTIALPRTFLFTILFILLSTTVKSQILNIERARISKDTTHYWTGKGGVDFSMFNRNAGKDNPNNYLSLTLNADIAYISKYHAYMLFNNLNYVLINYTSREERNTVANNGFTHFRVNLWHRRKLTYELYTQYQYDDARGLNMRLLNGGGVRYTLRHTDKVSFFVGSGFMWEREEWRDPEVEGLVRVSDLPKSSNYFSARAKFSEAVGLNSIVYFQTGYDHLIDAFRNRVSGDVSLNTQLSKHLTMRTGFNCTFENRPIVPVTNFIYSITNGIQVSF
ncbi:DUF481 domain-containing protein [Pontibacter sp. SGAir0037]|uniref:DUF481 domain-containing protein n=1 Tax=Pontibacter sp. SGAir0037 TaxID=2571030 RepID=UPI0010CD4272|nr:DUF481 domain-containing protein [Pontibacter sp. SGAir0037]QCR22192.1 hypothetical protein C1N53_07440 [Pontibacter sp. SGAir0037]